MISSFMFNYCNLISGDCRLSVGSPIHPNSIKKTYFEPCP